MPWEKTIPSYGSHIFACPKLELQRGWRNKPSIEHIRPSLNQQKDSLAQKRTKGTEKTLRWKRYFISGRNQFPRFCLVLRFGLSSIWTGKVVVLIIWGRSLDQNLNDDFVGHMITCNGSMTHLPPERSLACSRIWYLNLYPVSRSIVNHCFIIVYVWIWNAIHQSWRSLLAPESLSLQSWGLSHPSNTSRHKFEFGFDLRLHDRVWWYNGEFWHQKIISLDPESWDMFLFQNSFGIICDRFLFSWSCSSKEEIEIFHFAKAVSCMLIVNMRGESDANFDASCGVDESGNFLLDFWLVTDF